MASGNGNGRKNGENGAKDSKSMVQRNVTATKRATFLDSFRNCGVLRVAAEAAGIHRKTHYEWLKTDPKYREDFDTATRDAIEALEYEAITRATVGSLKPIFFKGEAITIPCQEDDSQAFPDPDKPGHHRKLYMEATKSDILLMFVLKHLDPSYRENHVLTIEDHTGSMAGLSHDEAVIKKALLSIDTFDISEGAKQELRDRVNSPE